MSTKKQSHFEKVVEVFGTQAEVARAIDISRSAVSYWKTRYKGEVPHRHWRSLLKAADKRGLKLSITDLI